MGKPRLFTTVPTRAIADTALTALDLRCLMVISLHDGMSAMRGNGSGCYAKSSTLAELAQTDISNFSKSVSRLLKLGYITREAQQSDKRRFTLRVIFQEPDSWRNDQLPASEEGGEIVGEAANDPSENLGELTNDQSKIVGEADLGSGGFSRQTSSQYILQSREIDFEESRELNSIEMAQRAEIAPRRSDANSRRVCEPKQQKDLAEAMLGRRACVSIAALLPKRFEELDVNAQLASFERAFSDVGRDADVIEPDERALYGSLLFTIADAFSGEQEGHRAQRLYLEFGE